MKVKVIALIWIRPESWGDRTKFKLMRKINVNGYVIPKGFVTDGASIPWGMRNTFNPVGIGMVAFIAHDHRCDNRVPRKEANKLFHRDLLDCGVSRIRARMMYMGVEAYRIAARVK